MASRSIYKVIWINEMNLAQEKNFATQTEAEAEATLHSSWVVVLKIDVNQSITEVS